MNIYKDELLNWIDPNKLNNSNLSKNLNSISYLKSNRNKIDWYSLTENPYSYLIFKTNMDKLIHKSSFIKNSMSLDLLDLETMANFKQCLLKNMYAKKYIDEIYKDRERLKLYYLLTCKNPLFYIELEQWITDKKNKQKNYEEAKKFLDLCGIEVLNIHNIPHAYKYQKLFNFNTHDINEHINYVNNNEAFSPCMDFYDLNSFRYSYDVKHLENGLKYIIYGKGLIHKFEVNMKLICESISLNHLSHPLIDKYLQNNLLEKKIIEYLFFFLSSNPDAINLLEKYIEFINWSELSKNEKAMHLLKKNKKKIDYNNLSLNLGIFKYDYEKMKKNRESIKDGLTLLFENIEEI